MTDLVKITGELSINENMAGSLADQEQITGDMGVPEIVRPAAYTGEYNVTPTQETQTLPTDGLCMTDNITINPIPSNYGLITWNGTTLTVS